MRERERERERAITDLRERAITDLRLSLRIGRETIR